MKGDGRSGRVALVSDAFLNPPGGAPDPLAPAIEAGWGVIALPPRSLAAWAGRAWAAGAADQARELARHGMAVVAVLDAGDDTGRAALAEALASDTPLAVPALVTSAADAAAIAAFLDRHRSPAPGASALEPPVLGTVRAPLHPNVRRSPYFAATERAGATSYMTYNHMYMAIAFARDPREEYEALRDRVCLWDVGAERQTALVGRDACKLANLLCTREMRTLEVGQCRFTMICDEAGTIMTEPIVLRPRADTVWISHGDVDLTLWARGLARAHGLDVDVHEPDVAPIQVQGPRSLDLLRSLAPGVEDLPYYRCMETTVAGHPAVVSRTGWSRDRAYEIFPLGSSRAMELWDALERAGRPHGVIVAGPNLSRAVEQAITDTHWYVNSGMTPYEAGAGRLVDLDSAPFVGAEALARLAREPLRRHTVGVAFNAPPRGPMEAFWPVADPHGPAGEVRWAAYSYARERDLGIALVDVRVRPGDRVTVEAPNGRVPAAVAELPFEP